MRYECLYSTLNCTCFKLIFISIKGEEFIKLATEDDRGWCLGKIGSRVGLYPATYATEI